MFPDLQLDSVYYSQDGSIAERFFVPVLKQSVKFDRVSAYFSAKALSLYAEGLEYFGQNGHLYRLIISKDVSSEDFEEIKRGYEIKSSLTEEMIQNLRQNLSLSEERAISNLAYLISAGVVDIKIAFKTKGIFHDKCGIATDSSGNKICFRGSNNETEAAAIYNYETFAVTCSWMDCRGFYLSGIKSCEQEFQKLWENRREGIYVVPAQNAILKEILTHNKGQIIVDEVLLKKNAVILDFDKQLKLYLNVEVPQRFIDSFLFKVFLKSKVSEIDGDTIFFRSGLGYLDFEEIRRKISQKISSLGFEFYTTQRYRDYIEGKNIHIEGRRKLGTELKFDQTRYQNQFNEFCAVVNSRMSRKLRPQQLHDAFFMLAMQKSGNFSVPGSGKTSSALAVYCYLKAKNLVNRILVIGPKNCFDSWKSEFKICFAEKEPLSVFDIQASTFSSKSQKSNFLLYNGLSYNLILFNYEQVGTCEKTLAEVCKEKTLLIFDEVHRVKKINGNRATHALNVAKDSNYTIVMTGTPIPNSYQDVYNLLHLLFPYEYKAFFNFNPYQLSKPSEDDIERINSSIQPFFCRTTKDQLHVPPPNEDELLTVAANVSEQKVFEILCKKYRQDKLSLLIRVLQLESNPKLLLHKINLSDFKDVLNITDDIDKIAFEDYSEEIKKEIESIEISSKKNACIKQIQNLVSNNKSVIVWCIFQDSIESFSRELGKLGIRNGYIYGSKSQEERNEILSKFKSKQIDVLITNPHTMAESVSLHNVCHDAIYFEYGYNLVHLLQSKDRIHRLGLPDGQYTQYYYMQNVFKNESQPFSLDEAIYNRLCEKEQTMLNAIDNNVLEKVTTPDEDVEIIFRGLFG